jgi:lysozyme
LWGGLLFLTTKSKEDSLFQLVQLIKTFEGLRLKAYLCPAGVWTIGYGSTGPGIGPGLVWTREKAESRMLLDAQKYLSVAKNLCPNLTGKKLAVAADFAYNLGATRLSGSTFRRKVNMHDYTGAVKELNKWVWAGGKKLPGLILRRHAEQMLFIS